MSETNKPSAEQLAKFKQRANDMSLSEEVRAKFRAIVEKFEGAVEGESAKPAKPAKAPRKPRATKTEGTSKRGRKPASASSSKEDAYEKAKADLKKKTGKTEEECETIIEQYRELRAKAQTRKAKEEEASKENKKRVAKLERKGDIIEGTNEKTADAVIETATEEVADKIEKQIEAVEEKAEKEAKAEVAKDKTLKTPKAKKEAVEAKVEKKVAEKTKTIVKRVVIDTSALLTSIATTLGKFDKDSQKEFLIKLRSDIDKLLTKYAFGGMTDGASQVMNIQQSNLSASSVNPTLFSNGGEVSRGDKYIRVTFYYRDLNDIANQKPKSKPEDRAWSLSSFNKFLNSKNVKGNVTIEYINEDNGIVYDNKTGKRFMSFSEETIYAKGGGVSGNQNERFLNSLDAMYQQRILTNIANHYGISIVEAKEEVTDDESEALYEYITDETLRMKVYNDMKNRRYAKGGGVRSYGKGGRMFGEDARLEYVDDAFASEDLKDELREKLGIEGNSLGENVVISFAYTDYGGDFLDKVAIRYFEENYPENTLVENAGYGGQNAYVFGEPAQEWIDTTDDYPLGFESIEDLYYEMQNEAEYESFDYFLDDLERDDYVFDKDEVMSWLMENKGGYYSMTTQGLDFSYSDLTDELLDEGLISKEDDDNYAHGGQIGKELMGGQSYATKKPSGAILLKVIGNGREIIVTEDGGKTKERYVRRKGGFSGYALYYNGDQYEFTDSFAKGGLTAHGLKVGDKIDKKLDSEGSVIRVKNKRENAFVILDSGFRNPIPKMAKGGGISSMLRNRRGK